jgi:NAD(P)-dependent dehydrogenase (short-subunit alcohol dehydrogenase family)
MKLPFEINLTDKVVVVTGAGGVLCSMFAEAMASTGAKVALLDLNGDAAKDYAEKINQSGGAANKRRRPQKLINFSSHRFSPSVSKIYGSGGKFHS